LDGLRENVAVAFLHGKGSAEYAAQLKLKPRGRPSFLGADLFLRRSFADFPQGYVFEQGQASALSTQIASRIS
jgi:hypothetical protein